VSLTCDIGNTLVNIHKQNDVLLCVTAGGQLIQFSAQFKARKFYLNLIILTVKNLEKVMKKNIVRLHTTGIILKCFFFHVNSQMFSHVINQFKYLCGQYGQMASFSPVISYVDVSWIGRKNVTFKGLHSLMLDGVKSQIITA
jgi:hypothetical protein